MSKMRLGSASALAACLAAAGCAHEVYSPPARVFPLETVDTLARGDTGVQLEGSQHGALFGVQAWGGSVRARYGLLRGTDIGAEASYIRVSGDSVAHVDPAIYSVRFGGKQRLLPSLAVVGGAGAGYSAAGAFISPEVGPIAAYENRYLVPFLSMRAGLSVPIAPRDVDTAKSGEDPEIDRPRLTWLLGPTAGLRLPLPSGRNEDAHSGVYGSLLGGIGLLRIADRNDGQTLFQCGGGFELVL